MPKSHSLFETGWHPTNAASSATTELILLRIGGENIIASTERGAKILET
jgi:hypothetical protein